MKLFSAGLIAILPLAGAIAGHASHLWVQAQSAGSFDGSWQGQQNDLPAIELRIENSKTNVIGTLTFFLLERKTADEAWHVSGKTSGPILVPHVDGKVLTFEAQHHKCHNCEEFGPNIKFRVELAGPNELRLWMLKDENATKDPGPGLKLVRIPEPAPSDPAKAQHP